MIRLIIHGANGTMGKVVTALAQKLSDSFKVVAGIDKFLPKDDFGFPIFDEPHKCDIEADVIIDFSLPDALPALSEFACQKGLCLVVATTGLRDSDYELLNQCALKVPTFVASNMSLGVNLQVDLIKKAASILGSTFDIEILEKHHNLKVDAPSGTALTLANAIKRVLPEKHYVFDRHAVRQRREKGEIGLHAIRGGTIVGEHEVLFIGEDEILEINHKAYSKRIFATGALRAAQYIFGKEAKLYSMEEVVAEQNIVTNVYIDENQSIVTLASVEIDFSIAADVFSAIANEKVNVDMISQTAPNSDGKGEISFTMPDSDIEKAKKALATLGLEGRYSMMGVSKLSVEGVGMQHRHGIASKVFSALKNKLIPLHLITTSETIISLCVDKENAEAAKAAVLSEFGM